MEEQERVWGGGGEGAWGEKEGGETGVGGGVQIESRYENELLAPSLAHMYMQENNLVAKSFEVINSGRGPHLGQVGSARFQAVHHLLSDCKAAGASWAWCECVAFEAPVSCCKHCCRKASLLSCKSHCCCLCWCSCASHISRSFHHSLQGAQDRNELKAATESFWPAVCRPYCVARVQISGSMRMYSQAGVLQATQVGSHA